MIRLRSIICGVLAFGAWVSPTPADVSASSAQAAVPVEQEPMHALKFENAYVRVFDVLIPPGSATRLHVHANDGVGVRLTDGRVRDAAPGGQPSEVLARRGEVRFTRHAQTVPHTVANVGVDPYRNFFVEILPSKAGAAGVPVVATAENRPLVLDNERVRAFHMTLAPGQSTGMHAHDLESLGVAVTDGTLVVEVPGQPPRTVEFRAGQFQWRESGYRHSLRNVGAAPFEAVDIELK